MKNTLNEQIAYVKRVIDAYKLKPDHNEKADVMEILRDIQESLEKIPVTSLSSRKAQK